MSHERSLSPLMLALYEGKREVAEEIRATRDDLDVFEAAALGEANVLRERLQEDPSGVSAWSPDGFTALHYAAFFGGPEAVRIVVAAGADLELPARNEEFAPQARPLHSAAAAGRVDSCAALLEAGADPNAKQHGGYTPLLEAAAQGNPELVDLLLRHGADPDTKLADGRSAADLAAEAGDDELAERLRQ